MQRYLHLNAVLLAGLLVACPAFPAPVSEGEIDAFVHTVMERWAVPGIAVAVVQDGQVVLAKGFGVREAGTDTPVDADTIFEIGSMTKPITATSLAILVDDGHLDWDTPVSTYLPDLAYSDPWLTQHATVRDLAANRLGIDETWLWLHRGGGPDRMLKALQHIQPDSAFRSFRYSNTGYITLASVAEAAGPSSWPELVSGQLFDPAGMTRSYTGPDAYVPAEHIADCHACSPAVRATGAAALREGYTNVAAPHDIADGPGTAPGAREGGHVTYAWRRTGSGPSAGDVRSTANDMARFLLLHLGQGEIDDQRIFSARQAEELHRYHTLVSPRRPSSADTGFDVPGYALGWRKSVYHGLELSSHGGGRIGFSSMMWLLPEADLGVVVMHNLHFLSSPAARVIGQTLLDRYAGLPPTDWNALAEQDFHARGRRDRPETNPVVNSSAILGEFFNPILGDVRFLSRGGRLQMQFQPLSSATVEQLNDGRMLATFEATLPNPIQLFLSLEMDDSGIVQSVVASEGPAGKTYRLERRKAD